MVNLVHLSAKSAAIQDNNFPGKWLWLPRAMFLERWRALGGGWAVVLLKAGPPPIPVNANAPVNASVNVDASSVEVAAYPNEPLANFGVNPEKFKANSVNEYGLNGQACSKAKALAALAAENTLTDDSAKGHVTLVGTVAEQERLKADWANSPQLAIARQKLHLHLYSPEDWAVADVGFASGISVQGPARTDGKAPVQMRLRAYAGPESLAAALRQADPNYQPALDPDPAKPVPAPTPAPVKLPDFFNQLPAPIWLVAGFILMFLFRSKESVR
jgi:hypothetical protein